jgi:molybdopterin adenylyltransferase
LFSGEGFVVRVGILTVSDRSFHGQREDLSGPALVRSIQEAVAAESLSEMVVAMTGIVPDERDQIAAHLVELCDVQQLDVVLTTGGTGFAPRDVTPEATLDVLHREAPGLAEAIRSASLGTTRHAMLSRGVAGIRNRTLIVNLPGSPRGAVESLAVILPVLTHAVELLHEEASAEAHHS